MKKFQLFIVAIALIVFFALPAKADSEFTGLSFDEIFQILESRREDAKMGRFKTEDTWGKPSAFVIYDRQSLYISLPDWDQLPYGFKELCHVIGIAVGYESQWDSRILVMICDTREYTYEEAREKFGSKLPSIKTLNRLKDYVFNYWTGKYSGPWFDIAKEVMEPFLLDMYCWTAESVSNETDIALAFNTFFRDNKPASLQKRSVYDRLRVIPMVLLSE